MNDVKYYLELEGVRITKALYYTEAIFRQKFYWGSVIVPQTEEEYWK